jgi:hypothetical protein
MADTPSVSILDISQFSVVLNDLGLTTPSITIS